VSVPICLRYAVLTAWTTTHTGLMSLLRAAPVPRATDAPFAFA